MKSDTFECSFRDNIELNLVFTEEILSLGSKIQVDVQTLIGGEDLESRNKTL